MRRNLPSIVEDVAEELQSMFHAATVLQEQLGIMKPDANGIVALQSLDSLTQGLASLSEFLSVMVGEVPEDCHLDLDAALDTVCLSAMAKRLRRSEPDIAEHVSGDLELFA